MTRRLPLGAMLLAAGTALSAPLPASAQDDAQTREIETIVREYLLREPEVLIEALGVLEQRRAAESVALQSAAIAGAGPELFATPEGSALGNPDGDVTVVEFFDYNCGYCRRAQADKDALLSEDGQLRFVLKEIPVLGPASEAAARVSLAVRTHAPERYEAFHSALLGSRGVADEARAFEVVAELGLDEAAVRTAMTAPETEGALAEAARLADTLRIDGTPSYVLLDEVVPGAVGAEALSAKIANVRACGSTTC